MRRRFPETGRRLLVGLTVLCVVAAGNVRGQGETEIWTDKASYTEGETIEVTLKVSNPDAVTYSWTTHCNAPTIVFDDIELDYEACVTYTHHFQFSPGSWRSWTFPLRPEKLGLPVSTGVHRIVVRFAHLADTVYVDAPAFAGGIVEAGIAPTAHPDSVAAVKASLQAEVLWSGAPQSSFEYWQIRGMTLEEASNRFQGPHVFLSPHRVLSEGTSVDTDMQESIPQAVDILAFPNPFRLRSTIQMSVPVSQHIRLEVYDALGRRVASLHEGMLHPGETYAFEFAAIGLPSGQYFYRAKGTYFERTGSLIRF
jgi:hypothetical protein